jgi:hypothetical protein
LLVPRFLQLVALVLAFVVSGVPAWINEVVETVCAEECTDEGERGCSDEGCADCSIACSSCRRAPVVVPLVASHAPAAIELSQISSELRERFPDDPIPEGVFHPPRVAG